MSLPLAQNGVPVTIGWPGGLTISSSIGGAISTYLITQSVDKSQEAERVLVHDEAGNRVGSNWIDWYTKVTMKFVVKGAGLAQLQAVVYPLIASITPGSFLSITVCASQPDLVGASYEVQNGPKLTGTNKTYKEWSVDLELAPGITGTAAP